MQRLTRALIRRPRLTLLVHVLVTLPLAWGLSRLEIETDDAALHPVGDPVLVADRADRADFFDADYAVLLMTSREGGPLVASPEGLRRLERLHREVGGVEGIDRLGVRSLVSLLEPPADRDSVEVRRYLDRIPERPESFSVLLARIRAHDFADGLYLSADGRAAPLFLPLVPGADREATVERLERWLEGDGGHGNLAPGYRLRLTGHLVAEVTLTETVLNDLVRLAPLVAVAVALVVAATVRARGALVVIGIEAATVVIWTLGAMGHLGVPVTLVTTLLPAVLVAIAVVDEVHLLAHVGSRLAAGAATPGAAAVAALAEIGRPVVLTSITTAGALLSFAGASIVPLRHFGLFSAFGVLVAMVLTFTLVPPLIASMPPSWLAGARSSAEIPTTGLGALAVRRPGLAAAGVAALVALAVPGLLRLSVQDSWIGNLDPRSDLVTAERDFNRSFWGSYRMDVICDADDPDSRLFRRPQGLALIEGVRRLAASAPEAGGVVTQLLAYEQVARAWGLELPVSRLSEQELMRIDARLGPVKPRIDHHAFTTRDGSRARARILVRDADYQRGEALRRRLEAGLRPLLADTPARCHFGGEVMVALRVVSAIVGDQLRSLGWALVVLVVILAVAGGGPRRAVLTLIPVLASSAVVLGGMGYLGVPLGVATSMFAAVALGVEVDFSLHYAHAYYRRRGTGLDHREALVDAVATTGRGLRWSALVLALGFSVLALSALRPSRSLGLLLAASVGAAYLLTLLAMPPLLGLAGKAGGHPCRPPAAD